MGRLRTRSHSAKGIHASLITRHFLIFMDKTGIIVISLCVALLGVWLYQQNEYSKQLTHCSRPTR